MKDVGILNINSLNKNIKEMRKWYHKLIYLAGTDSSFSASIPILDEMEKINVNSVISESLISIPKHKYPMFMEDILRNAFADEEKIYILQHIDILFDPQLKINPVRLLENLSKSYRLLVDWPGRYIDGQLIYAEYGHPEYFVSSDFEGVIYK
ncbi:BREX-3 system P-loop-containing protein BrxF [Evansella clarkii]|uniref:BREX-3 system P-loop-containing protein BrxF n=1 Tax=Evansella clarkii TaxID=79879 RepID=UPI00111612F5|nr:BREX-3 system P-loop-containing protein BrxF [Evansella clarkii]